MIADLKNGRLPEAAALAKRLQFAITKKLGVIKQPYLFWPPDPKQNPPAAHILWAALILEDRENFDLAADILMQEHYEKMASKADSQGAGQGNQDRMGNIGSAVEDLISLIGPGSLQSAIKKKIKLLTS